MRHRTTQDLREVLFDTIEKLKARQISNTDASAVAKLSAEIVKTADLELRAAMAIDRLDSSENGINVGPLLLTEQKDDDRKAKA